MEPSIPAAASRNIHYTYIHIHMYTHTHTNTYMEALTKPSSQVGSSHSQCQVQLRKQQSGPRPSQLQSLEPTLTHTSLSSLMGIPESPPRLLLGDLEHAEALVLLQKLVLGSDLLSEAVQLLLLLLGTQVDARHGADDLPHLLELGFESVQVLVDIWAVLVHAFDDVVD